jgi:CoA:oxalate CoA-transferase
MAQPHLRDRGTVRHVHDSQLGSFDITGMPAKFSAWAAPASPRADLLGEHNEQILREVAGLSPDQIDALYDDAVLVRDPLLAEVAV